ncbi:DNA gyrase subunit A, chloroplastic/mitochondrial-like isoform X1 [Prunus avium]|uniref:DNA gyrase subunit A, chloroplastic/mitochondrial-like isoform X1 n=1 Tax=Prunus avium TaxID=42229 RepID=A0A6P5RB31_PRUAV|nr:DNA gyrase subunit A, chloroplastic/mitochondrial-like isoform X1 [Prunus avium]XP_021800013.1 DNA gyrase subunit A, chloroplastic/mitochondrial-like isoform X1 [Prunus avium]
MVLLGLRLAWQPTFLRIIFGELVHVLSVLIHNPEATLQELLEYVPGPDFPTGELIMGNLGILEAYRTGKGRIVVRGKTDVELLDSRTKRSASIIKEIPYQTNKSALVEKIAELVENKVTFLQVANDPLKVLDCNFSLKSSFVIGFYICYLIVI